MAKAAALHIGTQLRRRRIMLHISQEGLGAQLGGLTQQAVSKMERGGEISGSHLLELSNIFKVPVSYFFDGLEQPHEMTAADERLLKGLRGKGNRAA